MERIHSSTLWKYPHSGGMLVYFPFMAIREGCQLRDFFIILTWSRNNLPPPSFICEETINTNKIRAKTEEGI